MFKNNHTMSELSDIIGIQNVKSKSGYIELIIVSILPFIGVAL